MNLVLVDGRVQYNEQYSESLNKILHFNEKNFTCRLFIFNY